MVNQEIRIEADLHFCVGDPILCEIYDACKTRTHSAMDSLGGPVEVSVFVPF